MGGEITISRALVSSTLKNRDLAVMNIHNPCLSSSAFSVCSITLQLALAQNCFTKSPNRKPYPCCEISLPGTIWDSPRCVPAQLVLTRVWLDAPWVSSDLKALCLQEKKKKPKVSSFCSILAIFHHKYPKSQYSPTHYYCYVLIPTESHLLTEPLLPQQPFKSHFLVTASDESANCLQLCIIL